MIMHAVQQAVVGACALLAGQHVCIKEHKDLRCQMIEGKFWHH